MNIRINIDDKSSKKLEKIENWWTELTENQRLEFLNKHGWKDIQWIKKNGSQLPFVLKNWIFLIINEK